MDAATGLIYVGNGQYYDPATGRFLTRDARPNQNNPYTPIDPTSAMLAPLALLALVFGRKKSRGRWDMLVILLVLSLSLGMGLAACGGPGGTPTPSMDELTVIVTPGENIIVKNAEGTVIATMPPPNGTPTVTPTPCPTLEITLTRTPTSTPTPNLKYNAIEAAQWAKNNLENANIVPFGTNCANFVSQALHYGGGLAMTDEWKPWESSMQCSIDTKDSVQTPDCPWIQTGDLYSYLIQKMGFRVRTTFDAVPDYSNEETDKFDYLLLRAHETWGSFVDNVQPGDLVFYHDTKSYSVWSHVAITIEGRGHTNDVLRNPIANMPRVQEPFIAEHSGPPGSSGIRTMGDTTNQFIGHVEILYQP